MTNPSLWPGLKRFAMETLGIALLYIATAKLGFLAAIPPGNVTLLWPPSGVALAAVLLWGYRSCLGIALGALAANIWNLQGTTILPAAIEVAAGIALGSALQSAVAIMLLRRWIGPDLPLSSLRAMLGFAMAVAASCVVAATFGVTSLDAGGLIAKGAYAMTWGTWWLGDWMGMIVLAPLLLLLGRWMYAHPAKAGGTISLAWSCGLGLSLFLFIMMWRLETQTIATEFEADARAANTAIQETVQFSMHHLDAISGLYASDEVKRHEFRKFVTSLSGNKGGLPGIQALEWIPRVAAAERAQYEAMAQKDGFSGFHFTERTPEGKVITAKDRAEYYPVYFVEPYKGNESVAGYDLGSNPVRLAALVQARDTGSDVATAPITLVQEAGKQKGFLIFRPIYKQKMPCDSLEQRRENLMGFALGVYRVGDMIEASIARLDPRGREIFVFDENAPTGEQFLHHHRSRIAPSPDAGEEKANPAALTQGLYNTVRLDVADRTWLIITRPDATYVAKRRTVQPWGAMVAGLAFACLIILYLTHRQRTETALRQSNQELARLNEDFRSQQVQLIQSEKMSSVGQLAAGIAHEINNPAGFVSGNLDTLKRYVDGLLKVIQAQDAALRPSAGDGKELPPRPEAVEQVCQEAQLDLVRGDIRDLLSESCEGMERIARIVADLKDFSHIDKEDALAEADLNKLVDKVISVAWNELKYKCEVKKEYGTLPPVFCNGGQISQVVLNLLLNAVQAIEKSGMIRIRTEAKDGRVLLTVTDDGPGIPEAIRGRICDPFFTTKPVGKGTGLGLHICQKIVSAHHGTITVESEVGKGAAFTMALPLTKAESNGIAKEARP